MSIKFEEDGVKIHLQYKNNNGAGANLYNLDWFHNNSGIKGLGKKVFYKYLCNNLNDNDEIQVADIKKTEGEDNSKLIAMYKKMGFKTCRQTEYGGMSTHIC